MKNLIEKIDFTEPNSVKEAIQTLESSIYGGTNKDGEKVSILLEQNVGMTVITYQLNGWIRITEYDSDGFKESETFNGRWNRNKFKKGDIVIQADNPYSRKLKIVDFDTSKQKYAAKIATKSGEIDKRSIHGTIYVEEEGLIKIQ